MSLYSLMRFVLIREISGSQISFCFMRLVFCNSLTSFDVFFVLPPDLIVVFPTVFLAAWSISDDFVS